MSEESLIMQKLNKLQEPIIIGIAGDSGSGKTTFSHGIRELIGDECVQTIELDGYHKENREQRRISGRLPLDPEANHLALLLEHLQALKQNQTIMVPVYDHSTGDFGLKRKVEPLPVIIVEGLHILYPQFLPFIDFSIYADPSRDVKWEWKQKRDMRKRGHAAEELEAEMLEREAAYKRWIDFQKTNATIVIKIFKTMIAELSRYDLAGMLKPEGYKMEFLVEPAKRPLSSLKLSFDLSTMMDKRYEAFMLAEIPGRYWGREIIDIHIDGTLSPSTIASLANHITSYTGVPIRASLELDPASTIPQHHQVSTTRFTQLLVAWRFIELIEQKVDSPNQADQ